MKIKATRGHQIFKKNIDYQKNHNYHSKTIHTNNPVRSLKQVLTSLVSHRSWSYYLSNSRVNPGTGNNPQGKIQLILHLAVNYEKD